MVTLLCVLLYSIALYPAGDVADGQAQGDIMGRCMKEIGARWKALSDEVRMNDPQIHIHQALASILCLTACMTEQYIHINIVMSTICSVLIVMVMFSYIYVSQLSLYIGSCTLHSSSRSGQSSLSCRVRSKR